MGFSHLATAPSLILQTTIESLLLARAWSWGWVETLPPVRGEGECEDVRAGGAGQGLAALADIAEDVGWEDWALSVTATSSV